MPNDDTQNTIPPVTEPIAPAAPSNMQIPASISQNSAPPPTSVITSPQVPKKYGGKKAIITMFVITLLVVGTLSTIMLTQRQSLITGLAWDCSRYTFTVSRDGVVDIQNGSTKNEPSQKADVYINNTKIKTFDVPSLNSGQAVTLGTVLVPTSAGFTWRVDGLSDCENSGTYDATQQPTATPTQGQSPTPTTSSITATCGDVKTYDTNWKLLSADDLKNLSSGTIVRFAVSGTANSGTFDKARFTVNGVQRPEVTTKKPGSEEFYDEYTIPSGTTTYTVSAQVHHTSLGWL